MIIPVESWHSTPLYTYYCLKLAKLWFKSDAVWEQTICQEEYESESTFDASFWYFTFNSSGTFQSTPKKMLQVYIQP